MLQYDFEESVGYWVTVASHAMKRAIDAELTHEKITLRQFEVLAWLASQGELSQTELADRLCIEAPTLAGILARMERDGWLERHCCPDDRRKKRIRPTEQVEPVWNRMIECCRRVRERATAGIPKEDLELAIRVCESVRQNLEGDGTGHMATLDTVCEEETADS